MEQVNNHYHGPITMQGSCMQSHYVPAEKPYAVYAFVWEGPTMGIAQLIGTMLVGKPNKEGKMVFDGKPVYRLTGRNMLDFEHCFIPEDMGPLINDPMFLGFVGDTVDREAFVKTIWMELAVAEEWGCEHVIRRMEMAGLKVDLGGKCTVKDAEGWIGSEYCHPDKGYDYFLSIDKGIAIRVKVWGCDDKSQPVRKVFSNLARQIDHWEKVGITLESVKMMKGRDGYQEQVDEMLTLARTYKEYEQQETFGSQLYTLLECREVIGTGRCFYDDFVMGMKKARYGDYSKYDDDLEWAVSVGLIQREGNIIQFSHDMERMATWQWHWLEGDEPKKES